MKNLLLALALVFGTAIPAAAPHAEEQSTSVGSPADNQAARVEALHFLALVDAGSYTQTWDIAGRYLRGVVTREEWVKGLASARVHAGGPESRDLLGAYFAPSLADGTKGLHYVVLYVMYRDGKYWQEEVTVSKQAGNWTVDGYYIRPADASGKPIGS